jgi:Sulfatase
MGSSSRPAVHGIVLDGVHLAVLSSFALAQPIFDLLGRNAEFFVVRRSTSWDIVLFAVGITFVPPLVLLAFELVAGLAHPKARVIVHLGAVALLTGLFALLVGKRLLDISSTPLVVLAAAVGAGGAVVYMRAAPVRSFVTVLAPAPLLFLALFLFASPVSKITITSETHARVAAVHSRTPVVMVVFDEFPLLSLLGGNGDIDAVRYPNFAALAGQATWFRRTLSVSGDTTQAVPAILSGRTPDPDALPFFADHPDNLFTLFGGTHRLNVVEPVTSLCPAKLCPAPREEGFLDRERSLLSDVSVVYLHVVLPDELRERLPPVTGTWTDFRGSAVDEPHQPGRPLRSKRGLVLANALRDLRFRDEQFRAFVASIGPSSRPTLNFLHVLLPHHPWRYLPSGREYATATLIPGLTEDVWGSDPVLVEQAYQRHLLQVGFVDGLLGDLIARLRKIGLYDRSLVVVTADHGVSFRPNEPRRRFTEENIAELGLVPLFVKAPHQREGRMVDRLVRTTDILPTLADVLGVRFPWPVDGRSGFLPRSAGPVQAVPSREPGENFLVTPRELERKLAEALKRQVGLFGWGHAHPGLYRIGPHPELLGRPVTDLPVLARSGLTSELADPELFHAMSFPSGVSPAHIVGTLEGTAAGRDVVLAVNGRLAVTGRTFSFGGSTRFEALAPERVFRRGANDVEVYLVSESSGRIVLEHAP